MSYEPTNWKDGDLVTSAKLNKLEQGVANGGGGMLVVNCTRVTDDQGTTFTLDKTWKQIYDADYAVCVEKTTLYGNSAVLYHPIEAIGEENGSYKIGIEIQGDFDLFTAETENDYPTYLLAK